jgi:hypothetical protein
MNDPAIRHALKLNNEAVSFMLAGEDKAAVKALAEALAVMKRMNGTVAACDRDLSSQDAGISAASTSQTKSIDQGVVFHDNVAMPDLHYQMGSDFIYNRAFIFDAARPKEPHRGGKTDLRVYSACFIFNLALIYHRRGVNQRSARLLTMAEQTYEMGKRCVCALPLNHRTALFISLAATNNLSIIQFDLGSCLEARQGLNFLAYLINSAEDIRDLFSVREWEGLHLNMLLLNSPGSAPAA